MNSVSRIFDIHYRQLELFPKPDSLLSKKNGKWIQVSTKEFIENANSFASGLGVAGIVKGDCAAIMSANRPEWNIADLGMQFAGVISVPVYTTLSDQEIIFILNDCKAKLILTGDKELLEKIKSVQNKIPSLQHVYCFEDTGTDEHWMEIISRGMTAKNVDALAASKREVKPDDVATILYTSGTTGTPKGVLLTHNNIVSNVISCQHLCPVDNHSRALSFLPLCHSYERMLTFLYMFHGVSIYYAESMDKIVDNLKEVKPEVFSTVPRLLEKVFDRIMSKGKEQKGIKKKLFFRAVDLGLKYDVKGNGLFYKIELMIYNALVFSKWREALGGKVKVIVSGGAALQPRLARVFWAAKIPVLEGYGLTETSPVIAVNNLEKNGLSFGTVGPVIDGVQVKIADDGEVLCKGPNVMKGYFNRTDLTQEVIDNEGWFHTGDIGTIVENRFLKITDRKKEIFKTSGGKYVAPQALENKFKESQFIEQIMVIGENRKYPAALIVPDFAFVKSWCDENKINFSSNKEIIRNEKLISRIQEDVNKFNHDFGNTEQIKKFRLVDSEWNIAGGELTATLKLKRKIIIDKNKSLIDDIYGDGSKDN